MTMEDAKVLQNMNFPILLYRAYDAKHEDKGISWSNNYDFIEAYATRHNLWIKERKFERNEIFAYISRRGEDEFIIL